jgi:hypothetical protein
MERSYSQVMDRYRGFEDLLLHVIQELQEMPDSEKNEWRKKIQIKCQRKMMLEANKNQDIITEKSAKAALLKLGYSKSALLADTFKMKLRRIKFLRLLARALRATKKKIVNFLRDK